MEEDIAQEKRSKLMQDASRPPRQPAATRTQTRAAGTLKRSSVEQTTTATPKKTRIEEPPKSPEVTIAVEAEQFVSPMVGESTNMVFDAPTAEEIPEVQSSEIQQCKYCITVSFFRLRAVFITCCLTRLTLLISEHARDEPIFERSICQGIIHLDKTGQ